MAKVQLGLSIVQKKKGMADVLTSSKCYKKAWLGTYIMENAKIRKGYDMAGVLYYWKC